MILNHYMNFYLTLKPCLSANTHYTRDGKNPNYWYPNERLTVEEVLKYYTVHNAYAAFRDDITGSINKGKYTDFVVHSVNFLTATPEEILNSKELRKVADRKDYYILKNN